ncbi:sorting nexin-22 isoform X2 [Ambystoma mexicanum]|uniref:sorting nexin-22 isoform X2 n=1 Tax=Ambystoma mexicanum TaxID=8296 RepID=UPI0037E95F75
MIEVYIPSVGPERPSQERARTVFKVDVLFNGRRHSLERRYSEFHALHKRIKKACKVPDFPPKRVPNWMPRVMEQRRQALEAYIQGVLWENQEVPKEVLEFLKLRHFQQTHGNCSIDSLSELLPVENGLLLCHQPTVGFHRDPYLLHSSADLFPDIIAASVLQGLFTQAASSCPHVAPKVPPLHQNAGP